MFNYSLDQKPVITDNKGNKIVDLAQSIFARSASTINQYTVKRLSTQAIMRPDIVSLGEYDTTEYTEFILKYTGISNPFTLAADDILMIPNAQEAQGQMRVNNPDDTLDSDGTKDAAIRNYFKFVNQDYKKDKSSYDNLANMKFESAIPDDTLSGDYVVPYISEDNTTAITIRNGRVYFGEDSGMDSNSMVTATTTNIDQKIQAIVDSTATAFSDSNCVYNGITLADFVRASITSNGNDEIEKARKDLIS